MNSSLINAEKTRYQPITKSLNAIYDPDNFADDFCLKSFTQCMTDYNQICTKVRAKYVFQN